MSLIEIHLPKNIAKALRLPLNNAVRQQQQILKKLLRKARFTQFGQAYKFDEILLSSNIRKSFQQLVPIYDYNKIYNEWWHKTLEGIPDVCWPGKIKYYALSSGTSESASKYIPITTDLLRGNRIVMMKQIFALRSFESIPVKALGKGGLMIGGSTDLQKGPGYFAGDLSGITAKRVPFWFTPFYKPGKKIAKEKDWNKKLEEIVDQAHKWDIGYLTGVPAWIQLCLEKIIEHYKLNNIHELWPNLSFFIWGGVAFEPYKKGFEKLLAHPLTYVETYLASEGFIAYQDRQNADGMRLVTHDHIYLEFIPFNEKNFDAEGNVKQNAEVLMIDEIEEGHEYALVLSTSAGTWRYLIGDTIKLTNKERNEISITGRTKHFLSLVGEHLSVDNMNHAVQQSAEELNIHIPEFTVAGVKADNLFAHHWYIACNNFKNNDLLAATIDKQLKLLNDDYATERIANLKNPIVTILPESTFMEFMRLKGKMGGQHKFPRVIKNTMLEDWNNFITTTIA